MKILVAPQQFKGTLTAREATEAICRGLRAGLPDVVLDAAPIADGGSGTVEALMLAKGSTDERFAVVTGPLGQQVRARWGTIDEGATAVLEMASASGTTLVSADELRPLDAHTVGTGELIAAALDAGCRRVILGLGDSATCDGGMGALTALGVRFLDARGQVLTPAPRQLPKVATIDTSALDPRLAQVPLELMCDVRNPLLGEEGAARVYGPQKGADADQVELLEAALEHLARVLREQQQPSLEKVAGSGAAGGLAFGLASVCGAHIKRGFDVVSEAMGLFSRVAEADVVVTGEGRIDAQTAFSKGPWALGRLGKMQLKRVVAFAGIAEGPGSATREAFDEVIAVSPNGLPDRAGAATALEAAARRWAQGQRPRASRDDLPRLR